MQTDSKWTKEECDKAIGEVADMARVFHPEGYLNLHAMSQVGFELACQRNALHEALEEIDRLAEAGLCQFKSDGKHAFLQDIRRAIAELGIQGGLTTHDT